MSRFSRCSELHAVVAQYLLLPVACVDEEKHGGWKKHRIRVWKKKVSLSTSVPHYLYLCLYLCLCVSICVLCVPSTLGLYLFLFMPMSCLIAGGQTGGSCTNVDRREVTKASGEGKEESRTGCPLSRRFFPTSVPLSLRLCVCLFMSLCLAGHLISTPWVLELMSGSELDHQCSIWKVRHLKCTDCL